MKPLSGLIEISDDMLTERQNIIKEDLIGLGPPELICLYKYQVKNKFTSYHHVCGFPMGSEESIQEYFNSLLKTRPKKFLGKVRYEISESQFCIWNSFLHYDVRVDVKDKGIKSITIRTPSDYSGKTRNQKVRNTTIPTEMNSKAWNELKLSSMLRFWMSPNPIFRSIYNYPYKNSSALRLLTPPNFSDDELRYIVTHHDPSPELEAALASYLISTSNSLKKLKQLLTNIVLPKLPRVFCHFISFFPHSFSSNLSREFSLISNFAYHQMADDIFLAFSSVNFAIEMNDITMCNSAIPILFNSLWASPEACCGMAKVAIYRGSASDAIYFANAACYARKFRMGNPNVLECPTPKLESKKAPRARPKAIESELVSSQRSDGHYYLIYRTVVSITTIASSIKIRAMLKSKFGSISNSNYNNNSNNINQQNKSNQNFSQKSKEKHSNPHNHKHSKHRNNESNNSSSYLSSYSYDSDYDDSDSNYNSNSNSNSGPDSHNRFSSISGTNSTFNDEINSVKNLDLNEYIDFCGYPTQPESKDSSFLFDPGVITDSSEVPSILKNLPMSEDFSEISTAALNDIQLRDNILRTKKIEASQDARKIAIVAMKLGDSELFDMALNSIRKMKKDVILAEIMRMRVAEGKSWIPLLKTTEASQIPKMSMNEYNAMLLMSQISHGISSIIDDDKKNGK